MPVTIKFMHPDTHTPRKEPPGNQVALFFAPIEKAASGHPYPTRLFLCELVALIT